MSEFKRVGLLGRREHPGVSQVVAQLLELLDSRGIDVVLEDRLATLAQRNALCSPETRLAPMSIWQL